MKNFTTMRQAELKKFAAILFTEATGIKTAASNIKLAELTSDRLEFICGLLYCSYSTQYFYRDELIIFPTTEQRDGMKSPINIEKVMETYGERINNL